ncbi:YciI family protein [Streptomyces sp. NPDC018057]|uniref:YciI family protein n=1 Tax=unclassified Streptomyces TaxID=2593676 RepID=UPI0037A40584
MEYFCYHRDRPGSLALREELVEAHWSYMDGYADRMIARGPVFDEEDTLLGSVHILDLPGPAAARAFAFDEPNYQAGAYRDVLLRRWRNLLGRTMWDFPGGPAGGRRYLVIGLGPGTASATDAGTGPGTGVGSGGAGSGPVPGGEASGPAVPDVRDDLIAYGPLLSDDGTAWLGTAALVRARDAATARAVLGDEPYDGVEVHLWEFGGRR